MHQARARRGAAGKSYDAAQIEARTSGQRAVSEPPSGACLTEDHSVFRRSPPHISIRDILGYPPLVVRNPGLGGLLCGEARYHRRETSGHLNLNSKGQILLRNDPIGSFGMGMFFRHALIWGPVTPAPNAIRGQMRHFPEPKRSSVARTHLFRREFLSTRTVPVRMAAMTPIGQRSAVQGG